MDLYLIRHAIAFERDPSRWFDDSERPLTTKGEKRFRRAAAGVSRIVDEVDIVLSSGYTRAWQTAVLLNEVADWPRAVRCAALEPGHTAGDILSAAQDLDGAESVALVGHEPTLGELASYLVAGDPRLALFEFKKGGMTCVRFDGPLRAGGGSFRWLLTPKLLRKLGRPSGD